MVSRLQLLRLWLSVDSLASTSQPANPSSLCVLRIASAVLCLAMAAAGLSRTMRILLPRLLIPCLAVLVVTGGEFTHDRKRVGPLDLVRAEHGCLEEFEVSESTIIRTKDSRVLGAQFLNETDVGNREDCLALCCATRFCNVAVFEEKVSA